MSTLRNKIGLLVFSAASVLCAAPRLTTLSEFTRPDPFGGPASQQSSVVKLRGARNGYVSAQVIAIPGKAAEYSVTLSFPLPTDVFREWFHLQTSDGKYYPDALIPVRSPYRSQMPDPDNRIPDQTAQAFWVDLFVPADTQPGQYKGSVELRTGNEIARLPIELTVLDKTIPDEDVVAVDHNSYGTSWLFQQYPKTLAGGDDESLFRLIHAYHRIFYEHRGQFHQLGYGHGGKVGPEFAPELTGEGRSRHVASWDRYDRHYGPLLDGTAFRNTRRGAKPIPFVYLPVNPEWPASFLWWGEPGYEAEFTSVLSEMERHFREKGWTSTRFELFFNHKKRYKGFGWDGDEIRFPRDNDNLAIYAKMLAKALPPGTPVKFVTRIDSSWTMREQFDRLKGVINFWVVGEGMLSWYPEAAKELMARGDVVWTYGGTPTVSQVPASMGSNPLRSWLTGVNGFVRWLTVAPGADPWFRFEGGGETLVYSGERFGLAEPVASMRLKVERNCLQDIALLDALARAGSADAVRREAMRRFNGTTPQDWMMPLPAGLASKPLLDWNNDDIGDALKPLEDRLGRYTAESWSGVREYALGENR